ncbi:hypothetical protein GLOIN_2v1882336 [Rhizophagus irregularis DAOM 181602=DAOM 197198]|nr:hypothetical protein GLOIN_2v1882336 [Rhizophagus irregularis DAOM 181602=DAOM 197198]
MSNNSNNKKNNKKNNKQKQQRFQEETPDEGSNRQRGRTEEESNPNETSDKTNKSTSKSSPTMSNKQKQQRFQEETPDEGSNRQWGRTEEESNPNETKETPSEGSNRQRGRAEEESDPNETSDKTNKSTSKSSLTKSNKQKQQRFQEETPDEGFNRQRGRTEEESNPNETIDKTNKSTSKSSPIKSILKSAKSTKPTQEESDDEVIEIEPPNIPKDVIGNEKRYGNIRIPQKFVLVVKDDQGNERMIDDDDTDLEAENLKLKKQIEEVQVENAKLQRENNRLFDENRFLTRINEAFADENDDLRESLNRYSRIRLPKAIHRQTDLEQPAKRQKRIKTKKSERYEEESEEERSGSNNNDEYDEKEARAEMKSILKTIDETRGLDYNETFNSAKNLKIRRKLVPELRSALAPCFPASNKQLTKWLGCLHKSRRSHQRLMDRGKADENKHRVHSNNRVHDKKIRRIKAAKRLYSFDDERITKYDKRRLLKMLSNRLFHSPEISETDEEDPTKSIIAIYDYSWRSDELKNLLRNVLDVHSSNKSKLIRERRYDDEGLITEYDEEEEEVSRGTTPATGNTTENDEDHNKEGEEKPSKSTVGDNHNNSDSDLHMDDAQ